MKVDIVYTWVNGADTKWLKRKSEKLEQLDKVSAEANSNARFMDNNELLYSLRSIEYFAPWVNNIFIITDDQIPSWLNTFHPKIHIIDHKDIFADQSCLPTFSARGIESQIHHIENLSEHFIYFNDDMFLGNSCGVDHFFIREGLCRVFVSEMIAIPNRKALDISLRNASKRNDHQHAIVNTRKLIRDKYNKPIYYNIRHGAKPLIRSVLYELESIFTEEISKTSRNSFRTEDDILMIHLFEFYSIIKGRGKPKYLKTTSSKKSKGITEFWNSKFTFGYINLHEDNVDKLLTNININRPFMICLNQTPLTPEINLHKIKKFLEEYFPEKSSFEL